jgi:cyclic pyranopterin phosphate synthase
MSNLTHIPPVEKIEYLRISLTESCNFLCRYCRDRTDLKVEKNVITPDQIENVVKVFSEFGLKTVRYTGGEPLLRTDVVEIVKRTAEYVEDVSLTTNGFFLKKYAKPLKEAGLKRLNVSLDSLNERKFKWITGAELKPVLEGLKEAQKAGFEHIKINTVAVKGFTEEEIEDLLKFASDNGFHLRFIELMPIGRLKFFSKDRFLPLDWIKEYIENRYGELIPLDRTGSGASKDFYLPFLDVRVGFIKSVTEPFCEGCKKLRLTADGKIHFCLRWDLEYDIKPFLDDEKELKKVVPKLLRLKAESNFFIQNTDFGWFADSKNMVRIGG